MADTRKGMYRGIIGKEVFSVEFIEFNNHVGAVNCTGPLLGHDYFKSSPTTSTRRREMITVLALSLTQFLVILKSPRGVFQV